MMAMYEKLSKSDEIYARLEKEGKVTEIETSSYLAGIKRMNKYMEEVRSDFRIKDSKSQISASRSILNS